MLGTPVKRSLKQAAELMTTLNCVVEVALASNSNCKGVDSATVWRECHLFLMLVLSLSQIAKASMSQRLVRIPRCSPWFP